jgi:hypothetical protein
MAGRNWDTTKISPKIGKSFAFSKKNQEIVVSLTNCQLLTGGGIINVDILTDTSKIRPAAPPP